MRPPLPSLNHLPKIPFQAFRSVRRPSREIASVDPARIVRAKNIRNGQGAAQLRGEAGSGATRAGTRVAILLEGDMARPRVAGIPDAPPGAIDDVAQRGVLDADAGVLAPRAAEVHAAGRGSGRGCGGDVGLVDHVVRDVGAGGATTGRDEAVAVYAEVAAVDPGDGVLPEDKVGRALDVRFGIDLLACLCEQRVLVAVQANAVVALGTFIRTESNGLRSLAWR